MYAISAENKQASVEARYKGTHLPANKRETQGW